MVFSPKLEAKRLPKPAPVFFHSGGWLSIWAKVAPIPIPTKAPTPIDSFKYRRSLFLATGKTYVGPAAEMFVSDGAGGVAWEKPVWTKNKNKKVNHKIIERIIAIFFCLSSTKQFRKTVRNGFKRIFFGKLLTLGRQDKKNG